MGGWKGWAARCVCEVNRTQTEGEFVDVGKPGSRENAEGFIATATQQNELGRKMERYLSSSASLLPARCNGQARSFLGLLFVWPIGPFSLNLMELYFKGLLDWG